LTHFFDPQAVNELYPDLDLEFLKAPFAIHDPSDAVSSTDSAEADEAMDANNEMDDEAKKTLREVLGEEEEDAEVETPANAEENAEETQQEPEESSASPSLPENEETVAPTERREGSEAPSDEETEGNQGSDVEVTHGGESEDLDEFIQAELMTELPGTDPEAQMEGYYPVKPPKPGQLMTIDELDMLSPVGTELQPDYFAGVYPGTTGPSGMPYSGSMPPQQHLPPQMLGQQTPQRPNMPPYSPLRPGMPGYQGQPSMQTPYPQQWAAGQAGVPHPAQGAHYMPGQQQAGGGMMHGQTPGVNNMQRQQYPYQAGRPQTPYAGAAQSDAMSAHMLRQRQYQQQQQQQQQQQFAQQRAGVQGSPTRPGMTAYPQQGSAYPGMPYAGQNVYQHPQYQSGYAQQQAQAYPQASYQQAQGQQQQQQPGYAQQASYQNYQQQQQQQQQRPQYAQYPQQPQYAQQGTQQAPYYPRTSTSPPRR
jgi:hypothetical protein